MVSSGVLLLNHTIIHETANNFLESTPNLVSWGKGKCDVIFNNTLRALHNESKCYIVIIAAHVSFLGERDDEA